MNKQDIQTRQDIASLVSEFYTAIIDDPEIGHFFKEVVPISLEDHLPVITDFWETILLSNPVYRGNPMEKHLDFNRISPLTSQHIDVWLHHWTSSIRNRFEGPIADMACSRAKDIAGIMAYKVNTLNGVR